jgi:hypothetical protein
LNDQEITMQTTEVRTTTEKTKSLSLDDLSRMRSDELLRLYQGGKAPKSMFALDGALTGRMLAVKKLEAGGIARRLRAFAGSRKFVWGGKTFSATNDREGTGINRVIAPGVLGRQNLFPFTTLFASSEIDGKTAVILDYDHPENPPYIRRIHDEVREVSPGVYLGPAMWKSKERPITVLWFALDTGKR